MDEIVRKAARFTIIFTGILLLLFLLIDSGLFGDEVKVSGLYYIFMSVFLLLGLWGLKNSGRFKGF
jgi:hypothetical protein